MNMEYEIKLSPVFASQVSLVFADPAVAPYLGDEQSIKMRTEYFDTVDGALEKTRHTLRLRWENGRGICTIKGPETETGRLEIGVEAGTMAQGVAFLAEHPDIPRDIKDILHTGKLTVTCGALFTRTLRRYSREGQEYEFSFDQGQLECGNISAGLSEMEIELIAGEEKTLDEFAAPLIETYMLPVEKDSKKKRALALGVSDAGKEVNPYFIGSEMLNFCVKKGYLLFSTGEDKRLHYTLTEIGEQVLTRDFGVNFAKPCAVVPKDEEE